MKICAISDTHSFLDEITVEDDTNLILHAGDFTFTAKHDYDKQTKYMNKNVLPWIEAQKAKGIDFLGCWGNHDFVAVKKPHKLSKGITDRIFGERIVEYEGLKIFFTAWQNWFFDWAFNAPQMDFFEDFLTEKYKQITEDVDIVVTHGPPKGIGDKTLEGDTVGSVALKRVLVSRQNPITVITGHIHEGYGVYDVADHIKVINASFVDRSYSGRNKPIYFNL